MKISFSKWYVYFSWLPLASYLLATNIINRSDGWGAWAVGPVLIYPILFSLLFGLLGAFLIVFSIRAKNLSANLVIATLLSSSIALWFLGLALIKEIQISF